MGKQKTHALIISNNIMGDRISIQFQKGEQKSVALFSHWQGESLVKTAKKYLKALKVEIAGKDQRLVQPIDRLEPETVMVDFIREITKNEKRIESDLYLGKDENDGDNSDNGNVIIKL